MSSTFFQPSRIFDGTQFYSSTVIEVAENKVKALIPLNNLPKKAEVIPYPEYTIAPAYKDIQIYGGNGKMFSLFPSVDSLKATYEYSLSGGATGFMACVPTSSMTIMEAAMDAVYNYWQQGFPGLLGLHLEGPYLNAAKKGAHIERFIQRPTLDKVKKLIARGKGTVKMMTVAPECCPDEVIHYLLSEGILVSAGHSNATYEEARHGFDLGITTCTHFYNAMSAFEHRKPGLVGAILDSHVCSSIIPDGVHVLEPAVRIASQVMGDRLFFITDAITEARTDSYQYIREADRYITENGTLAGSCLTMGSAVQKAIQMGLTPEDALRKAATIPAAVIGKDKVCGKIAPGYAMDWVLLDDDFQVKQTLIG